MNWGKKIVFVYVLFVAGIIFMVFKASTQNIDLVSTDYYEQELKYQQRINESNAASNLSQPVKCEVKGNELKIVFPAEMQNQQIDATIWLYYPADKTKDMHKEVSTSEGKLLIPITNKNKGLYEMKLSWISKGKKYYSQQKLFIQ
ncbi:MAG: FixH family protein [Ferruginibacter sp.]